MEAQTNQTISKLLTLREAEKIGHPHLVAKRKIDTTQSDNRGRKMKKIKSQSQSHDSGQLSSELAGGKVLSLSLSLIDITKNYRYFTLF